MPNGHELLLHLPERPGSAALEPPWRVRTRPYRAAEALADARHSACDARSCRVSSAWRPSWRLWLCRRRSDAGAHLHERAEEVSGAPPLCRLTGHELDNVKRHELQGYPSAWHTQEAPDVRAAPQNSRSDLAVTGDSVLDAAGQVGKSLSR